MTSLWTCKRQKFEVKMDTQSQNFQSATSLVVWSIKKKKKERERNREMEQEKGGGKTGGRQGKRERGREGCRVGRERETEKIYHTKKKENKQTNLVLAETLSIRKSRVLIIYHPKAAIKNLRLKFTPVWYRNSKSINNPEHLAKAKN